MRRTQSATAHALAQLEGTCLLSRALRQMVRDQIELARYELRRGHGALDRSRRMLDVANGNYSGLRR